MTDGAVGEQPLAGARVRFSCAVLGVRHWLPQPQLAACAWIVIGEQ